MGVVLASEGYPERSGKGDIIEGIEVANRIGKVFHAGTAADAGRTVTNGGRLRDRKSVV